MHCQLSMRVGSQPVLLTGNCGRYLLRQQASLQDLEALLAVNTPFQMMMAGFFRRSDRQW